MGQEVKINKENNNMVFIFLPRNTIYLGIPIKQLLSYMDRKNACGWDKAKGRLFSLA